ncbi:condensation domain-containing protein, partial [Enterococcus faecium]
MELTPGGRRGDFLQVRVQSGEGLEKTFPGTWAQQAFWDATKALGEEDHQFNFSQSIDIGDSISIGEVWEAVAWMVRRHESFRTLFVEMPGGRVGQRVLDAVEVPVRIIETGADLAASHADDAVNDWE